MDRTVEATTQRVRHHLRRTLAGTNLLIKNAGNTVSDTAPIWAGRQIRFDSSADELCVPGGHVREIRTPSSCTR
jgi:hypothetical protein